MRALILSSLLLAIPAAGYAQAPKMLKVHIIQKSEFHGKKGQEGPKEINVRTPISLVKATLGAIDESEIKINGKTKKGMKLDDLVKLLETAKSGDMLLEVTTDKGDLVKITVE